MAEKRLERQQFQIVKMAIAPIEILIALAKRIASNNP
jgi:hypothetical protein